MKRTMLRAILPTLIFSFLFIASCKEKDDDKPSAGNTYNSLADFYKANSVKSEHFTVNATSGGSFTTTKGTKVTIKPNGLTDAMGNPVSGNVKVEFKDIYNKSDMLLSEMPTMMANGAPLKSGGEFFIKITQDGKDIIPAPNQAIKVEQPLNGLQIDTSMRAFVWGNDSAGNGGWNSTKDNELGFTPSSYIMSLYKFAMPYSEGTWCNSDNPDFFSSYTQTVLNINPTVNPANYNMDVYLIFKGINSMIHVYEENGKFPYYYAPVGLQCTVVAIGHKDKKLYASYTNNFTLSANQTINVSLAETTEADFKIKLNALNH